MSKLPNIGSVVEEQLNETGVHTLEQLEQKGSRQAIRSVDPSTCYNRLCALEGAIQGIRWHDLPSDAK